MMRFLECLEASSELFGFLEENEKSHKPVEKLTVQCAMNISIVIVLVITRIREDTLSMVQTF